MPDLLEEAKRLNAMVADLRGIEPPVASAYIEHALRLIPELVERLEQAERVVEAAQRWASRDEGDEKGEGVALLRALAAQQRVVEGG